MSENSEQTAGEMPKPELTEQQAGERRVNELFVRPLIELGIGRPKNMSVKDFDVFKSSLAARLWRLKTSALVAMREWVEMHPEAVNDNRWPSGPAVLKEAKRHAPMTDALSERMVRIFQSQIGKRAIAEGWSPELFVEFVSLTSFPSEYRVKLTAEKAQSNIDRLHGIEGRLAKGHSLSPVDREWRDRRLTLMRKLEAASARGGA